MSLNFLINQHLDEKQSAALAAKSSDNDPILYAIVGEIAKDNRYATTALAVTATSLFTFDFENEKVTMCIAVSDIDKIFTKRMYGNGLLRVIPSSHSASRKRTSTLPS